MASIQKHSRGWRAQVAKRGVRKSKVLPTKRAAQDWASRQEYLIENSEAIAKTQTFGEVMDRYAREVSPTKRGERWEQIRLARIARDPVAKVRIGEMTAADLAAWRDRRAVEVGPGSVRREMGLLAAVLTQARKEWGLIKASPMGDVRKPSPPPPRDRLPTTDEIERMRHAAGADLTKTTARAFHAFLFSCETAMRAGEVVGLTWDRIDTEKRVARLPMTKNGSARDVPLSSDAVALLDALPKMEPTFGLSSAQLDSLFRKIRHRAGVDGLTYHDSRAAALTKWAPRLDVLDLAKMSGHRDIQLLSNVYYRETAEGIAKKLG